MTSIIISHAANVYSKMFAFLGDLLYENYPAFRKYYSAIYMQVVKKDTVCVEITPLTTNMF